MQPPESIEYFMLYNRNDPLYVATMSFKEMCLCSREPQMGNTSVTIQICLHMLLCIMNHNSDS